MLMNQLQIIATCVFLSFSLCYYLILRTNVPKGLKLPPGPPRRFLTGNLRDIPLRGKKWETYDQWRKNFGDLVYLNIFGKSILFVNSRKLVSEIFDARGAIYSERFRSTMAYDLGGFDWSILFMPPNETWRRHRAILQQHFGKTPVIQHQVTLEKHSKLLLALLSRKPVDFLKHTRHAIGAMILESTYGLPIKTKNDPYVEVAERAMKLFSEIMIPGAYLVDLLPFLKHLPTWLPGTSFKQKANNMKSQFTIVKNKPFTAVKEALKAGSASPSFVSNFLESQDLAVNGKGEIDEEQIKSISATIYLGGIDTTDVAIQIFFVAMVLYPNVQKAAQEELAKVIGSDALPTFKDRPRLPYINALCKEVLRWQPVSPLGFPHVLKQDDVIGEYFVPKGTLVMGTTWSILHSKADYGPDADAFNPERFLRKDVKDPDPVFGFGRRICPGRYMADNMMFIIIASILYTFDIKPDGTNVPSLDDFLPELVSRPKPFPCQITPRTPAVIPILEQLTSLLSENET